MYIYIIDTHFKSSNLRDYKLSSYLQAVVDENLLQC